MSQLGQPLEGAAEGNAWQRGGDLTRGAAYMRRRVHLRIEGLELRRPSVHEEEDDRPILEWIARRAPIGSRRPTASRFLADPGRPGRWIDSIAPRCRRPDPKRVRQVEPAQRQRAHLQELPTMPPPTPPEMVLESQHRD